MYPELFTFDIPKILQGLLQLDQIIIYSYPSFILIGGIIAYHFLIYSQKRSFNKTPLKHQFVILVIVMSYIGGKAFLIIDNPSKHLSNLLNLNFYISSGFVFYGSFLFSFGAIFIYLRRKNLPLFEYLDIIAIVTAILHLFGRLGCFLAGCCFGKPTSSIFGVFFPSNLNTAVHPTQLYEAIFIGFILLALLIVSKHKNGNGNLFYIYVCTYAVWRVFIENLRGDLRGTVLNGYLSQSQFIAMTIIIILALLIIYNKKKQKIPTIRY